MKFKGVVFDMDGTLVDTEPTYTICLRETIEAMGFPCTEAYIDSLRGMPNLAIQQKCVHVFGNTFDCKKYDELVFSLADQRMATNGVSLKTGVQQLLDHLQENGISYAIATSSTQKQAKKSTCHGRYRTLLREYYFWGYDRKWKACARHFS